MSPPLQPATLQRPGRHPAYPQAPLSPPSQLQPISSLAIFAAQMITWLWFSNDVSRDGNSATVAAVSKVQLVPSTKFRAFLHDVFATTQVSHSIVILALLFVYRLKSSNVILGVAGSEYRLAITALMMANKVLDDNTYTAKTWAEVSCLDLASLVAGEAEFLKGLDWQLHVTEGSFAGWIKLLQGHVVARETHLGPTSRSKSGRRVGTRRGREMSIGGGGVELLGLGLGVSASISERTRASTHWKREATVPWSSNDEMSTRSIPISHPAPFPAHLTPPYPIPSIPSLPFIGSQTHPRQLRSSTSLKRRRNSQTFSGPISPITHAAKRPGSMSMYPSRSFSARSSPDRLRSSFVGMGPSPFAGGVSSWDWPTGAVGIGDEYHRHFGPPADAGVGPGSIASSEQASLSCAVSPHYPQLHPARPLRFFALAAGQRQGAPRYHQPDNGGVPLLAPTPSSLYTIPSYPPISPSTLPYPYPSAYPQMHHAIDPRSSFSQFSNSGRPGVYSDWQVPAVAQQGLAMWAPRYTP